MDLAPGWEWNFRGFSVWPGACGEGPWGSGWRFIWGPSWPCVETKDYRLNLKIRF